MMHFAIGGGQVDRWRGFEMGNGAMSGRSSEGMTVWRGCGLWMLHEGCCRRDGCS